MQSGINSSKGSIEKESLLADDGCEDEDEQSQRTSKKGNVMILSYESSESDQERKAKTNKGLSSSYVRVIDVSESGSGIFYPPSYGAVGNMHTPEKESTYSYSDYERSVHDSFDGNNLDTGGSASGFSQHLEENNGGLNTNQMSRSQSESYTKSIEFTSDMYQSQRAEASSRAKRVLRPFTDDSNVSTSNSSSCYGGSEQDPPPTESECCCRCCCRSCSIL